MNQRRPISRTAWLRAVACVFCVAALSACGSVPEQSAVDQGRQLFDTYALSPSHLNFYSCGFCHDTVSSPLSKKTGSALAGVTLRTSFWGGQEADLLSSVNACRNYFMIANVPLSATDADARSLYAYLASLEPGDASAAPFTVVTDIDELPRGDATRGQDSFSTACSVCHGVMHTGLGRLSTLIPVLPEDTLAAHAQYTLRDQRLVFIEKIRHGLFLGYGGVMPPFSTELLADEDVSDILEALGVFGE